MLIDAALLSCAMWSELGDLGFLPWKLRQNDILSTICKSQRFEFGCFALLRGFGSILQIYCYLYPFYKKKNCYLYPFFRDVRSSCNPGWLNITGMYQTLCLNEISLSLSFYLLPFFFSLSNVVFLVLFYDNMNSFWLEINQRVSNDVSRDWYLCCALASTLSNCFCIY